MKLRFTPEPQNIVFWGSVLHSDTIFQNLPVLAYLAKLDAPSSAPSGNLSVKLG